uniref:Uncharacterized protein n=1 Tax=Sander lucioperca TaxID=283035 RepID=A0A8D0A7T9_SANLU
RQCHYVLSTVGLTTACLKAAGTEPKLRQELKKVRRLDPMVLLKTSFTILAGTMSRGPLSEIRFLNVSCLQSPGELFKIGTACDVTSRNEQANRNH